MRFESTVRVCGMKQSKGEMDNGQKYDSTKVYVEIGLDESKGTARGSASVEYSLGTSEEYLKFSNIPIPFTGLAQFEIVTSGKVQKTQMIGLVPVQDKKAA